MKFIIILCGIISAIMAAPTENVPVFSEKGTKYLESIGALNKTMHEFTSKGKRSDVMQINYYWDGGCSNFAAQVDWDYNWYGCYNYYIAGTWSNNIAWCNDANGCSCALYSQDDCGSGSTVWYAGSWDGGNANCDNNGGIGVRSMACSYT